MSTPRSKNNLASKKSYEKQVERDFAIQYEYEMVNQHAKMANTEVWHWTNIPEDCLYEAGYINDYNKLRLERLLNRKEYVPGKNRLKDYGFDGLARHKINDDYIYQGLQAKYYTERQVSGSDIGTFLAAQMALKERDSRSVGYLYSTTDVQTDLAGFMSMPSYPIKHIKYPWKHPDRRIKDKSTKKEIAECKLPLRDYQIEVLTELKEDSNGINALNIPCGLGKTVIAGHYLKYLAKPLIIAIAPLKSTVQNLKRLQSFLPSYTALLVDSDTDGTTNVEEIRKHLKGEGPRIIYTTFKSAEDILLPLIENEPELFKNGAVLGDEIHNATENICRFVNIFNSGLVMSATLTQEIEEMLDINIHLSIPFSKAIEDKYIVDYTIWLPHAVKKESGNEIEVEIPEEFTSYEKDITSKALFIATLMLKTGGRRCIVYLTSQDECDKFLEVAKDVFEKYHGLSFWGNKIIAETKEREKIIHDFQHKHSDDTFHILASVRVLDEGVDIPRCDTVFITSVGEKSSDIRMTQRSMRSARIDAKNTSKHNTIALWATGWEQCIDSLDNLRYSDPEFHKKVKVAASTYDAQIRLQEVIEKETDVKVGEITKYFEVDSVSAWEKRRLQWLEQYKKLGRCPSHTTKDLDEQRATQWQYTQRRYYKNKEKCLTNERIEILNNTEGWVWPDQTICDTWTIQLKKWIEQYKKLGRRPRRHKPKRDDDENTAVMWQEDQRKYYKRNDKCLTDERIKILNNTEGWVWEEKCDAWGSQLENWKGQYNRLGRLPSKCATADEDEKNAATWRHGQSFKYKKKEMIEERIKLLESTPGWTWVGK